MYLFVKVVCCLLVGRQGFSSQARVSTVFLSFSLAACLLLLAVYHFHHHRYNTPLYVHQLHCPPQYKNYMRTTAK